MPDSEFSQPAMSNDLNPSYQMTEATIKELQNALKSLIDAQYQACVFLENGDAFDDFIEEEKNKAEELLNKLEFLSKRTLTDVKIGDEVFVKCRVLEVDLSAMHVVENHRPFCVEPWYPNGITFWPHADSIRLD